MYYAAALAAFALPFGGPADYHPGPLAGTPMAGAAITAAAASAGRTYGAHTEGGEPIVFERRGRKLRTIVLQVHTPCDSGAFFPAATTLGGAGKSTAPAIKGPRLSRKGRFSSTAAGTADLGNETATVLMAVNGKLGRKHSTGGVGVDVSVTDDATGQETDHCHATETWEQTVPEGRVFGGSTSQDTPIVIELNRRHTSVRTFWFGVFADCTPDGAINPADAITNFRIRKHEFGDSFSDEGDDGSGGRLHIDYALKGRIGRASSKGTIAITAIDRDAQGNVTSNCPSGPVSWKARQ